MGILAQKLRSRWIEVSLRLVVQIRLDAPYSMHEETEQQYAVCISRGPERLDVATVLAVWHLAAERLVKNCE